MLYNFKNQLLGREVPASMKRQKNPAPDIERAELERQVELLRPDMQWLRLERDILTKANGPGKKGMGIYPQPCTSSRPKSQKALRLISTAPSTTAFIRDDTFAMIADAPSC